MKNLNFHGLISLGKLALFFLSVFLLLNCGGHSSHKDKTPPTLHIQSPANHSIVRSDVVIQIDAQDDVAVTRLEVTVDGNSLTVPAKPPYQITWDTLAYNDGDHNIAAAAWDAAGNQTDANILLTVDNAVPDVDITLPAEGVTVSGSLQVQASASDNTGLENVELLVNGSSQGVIQNAPFEWTIDTAALADGVTSLSVIATDTAGNSATAEITVQIDNVADLPPDPVTVAPKLDPAINTSFLTSTAFLYSGNNPIQTGVSPGAITEQRAAALRGRIIDRDGSPISGVQVTIHDHPELGQTLSRADGWFDLALNGGGSVVVQFNKSGLLSAQRRIDIAWNQHVVLPELVLIPLDNAVTEVNLSASGLKVMRGNQVTDNSGTRRATLLIPEGVTAQMVMADGSTQVLNMMHIRATEYTVGDLGPETMPAELPPTSGYTYALEYTADEALTAGATRVVFSQPLFHYVEDFIGFTVGGAVPAGYYDRQQARWIPSENGRVIQILQIANGHADLDTDGDGVVDDNATLAALGVTDAERIELANLYNSGQKLWRVPVPHFTPWDYNWLILQPPASDVPKPALADPWVPWNQEEESCNEQGSSIIECQNLVLREVVPISGTPVALHYRSDRVRGNVAAYTIDVPVTQANAPASLKSVTLGIGVAGKYSSWSWEASTEDLGGISQHFEWDGVDVFGRALPAGTYSALITIQYSYDGFYMEVPNDVPLAFLKSPSNVWLGLVRDRSGETRVVKEYTVNLYSTDIKDRVNYGGWTLNLNHTYDPQSQVLEMGNGKRRTIGGFNGNLLTPVVGTGQRGYEGDGGPANEALLDVPHALATSADGSLYITDTGNNVVRRVDSEGVISTVFAQAPLFGLQSPRGIAIGDDGSLYISEYGGDRIRRKTPDGLVTVFAGTGPGPFGSCTSGGDDGLAINAQICRPAGLSFGPDGSLYVAETGSHRIRRIAPDGMITTVAGGGNNQVEWDGILATEAQLSGVNDVAVAPDGTLYLTDQNHYRLRKVTSDGVITTVAGTGVMGHNGDGGVATEAEIGSPFAVDVDRNGRVFFSTINGINRWVRQVDQNGIISTLAGGGNVEGETWARRAQLDAPVDLIVAQDGSVLILERDQHQIVRVAPNKLEVANENILVPSDDASEYFQFNSEGRHLVTYDGLTHEVIYSFTYDDAGYLVAVNDVDGNITTIERSADESLLAIVGSFGDRTALTVNAEGYLSSIINPAGEATQLTYADKGLLVQYTDALGLAYNYTYDNQGRLVSTEDPVGATKELVRIVLDQTTRVTKTSGEGLETIYEVEHANDGKKYLRNTSPDGIITTTEVGSDGIKTTLYGDGSEVISHLEADPIWGMTAPMIDSLTISTPGGLSLTLENSRSVTLNDPLDPTSIAFQTDTLSINGHVTTIEYDRSTGKITTTTPEGRQTVRTIDAAGRTLNLQIADLAVGSTSYDNLGRMVESSFGENALTRKYSYEYDTAGILSEITDPLSRVLTLQHDSVGRVTLLSFSDGRQAELAYDKMGKLTAVTPPSRPAHIFEYNDVGLLKTYTPPGSEGSTLYQYNLDRLPIIITRPGGEEMTFTYEPDKGSLTNVSVPGYGEIDIDYATGGQVESISTSTTTGEVTTLGYAYDGSLVVAQGVTGPYEARVDFSYDNSFRLASETVNVGLDSWPVTYLYDEDDLLTSAGDLSYSREAINGLESGSSLGNGSTATVYNVFGEVTEFTASHAGGEVFSNTFQRDKLGRIIQKSERIGAGDEITYTYTYDEAGRLTAVTEHQGATLTGQYGYTYDTNGNRTLFTNRNGVISSATGFTDDDLLLGFGSVTYTYDAAGNRHTEKTGNATTIYNFDTRNTLLSVSLPNGNNISYIIDGLGRRVAKKVNGNTVQGFLYRGRYQIVAELNAAGDVVSRFVYGRKSNVPAYMIKGADTYRIISDQLGSVRLVINTSNGTIAQRIDYDAFGVIENNTNPGFQPFAFAGGLFDADTGLTHFGTREYDASIGRWLSRDFLLFSGGDFNLYAYVKSDPVNRIDPTGLQADSGCVFEIKRLKGDIKLIDSAHCGKGSSPSFLDSDDIGEILEEGDIIETGKHSRLELRLGDNAVIRLGPNQHLELTPGLCAGGPGASIKDEIGAKIRSWVKLLTGEEEVDWTRVPTGITGVRG
jgi:RHS repeat-associated protein